MGKKRKKTKRKTPKKTVTKPISKRDKRTKVSLEKQLTKIVNVTVITPLPKAKVIKGKLRENVTRKSKLKRTTLLRSNKIVRVRTRLIFKFRKKVIKTGAVSTFTRLSGTIKFKRALLNELKLESLLQALENLRRRLGRFRSLGSGEELLNNQDTLLRFFKRFRKHIHIRTSLEVLNIK